MKALDEAIRLAAKLHEGQFRDGDSPLPYIVHPIEVVSNLRYVGGVVDEDILVAGALHDTIEESDADPILFRKKFGNRATALIVEMTRKEPSESETKGMSAEEIWQLRSRMLLDEIGKMSRDCQILKLADRLSNVR
ncbi:MAG TPA: HD domain-containing protein, partial [Fimbriimonas sp.]|nr:HD domain-containing protein [Fimbriimonas sp.]